MSNLLPKGQGRSMIASQAMAHAMEPMPDYDNPPVVEAILGVQFDRLPKFRNAHLGAFWHSLGTGDWPTVVDAPLLSQQFETFEEGANWAKGLRVQVTHDPASRLQIKNRDTDRMIQVQNNRLHLNWLGKAGGCYPRYRNICADFFTVLDQFTGFVAQNQLGDLRANQWEITYVNHIPEGTVWNTSADWDFFKLISNSPKANQLVEEESFGGEWHFVIPPRLGRLHIEWQHGIKSEGENQNQKFIRLTLTGRGPIEKHEDAKAAIRAGFEIGHDRIVRTFKNLMSDQANKYWGLKNAGN